ncbi:MAG TPA: peptidase, partial [Sinorhizobium sp.]|nr:peptidase [Sinorhizobium sp.]
MGGIDQPTGDQAALARGFMDNHDLVDFAAAASGYRGSIRTVRDREDVLTRAFHSTSDFPAIFSSAINTVLERRYALALPTYRRISHRRDFMDFRPHYAVKVGEFPMLEKLTESGEIKFGTFGEGKEQIAVVPYAKGIRISRQMMVNDRLGAIGGLLGGYGRTVSRFEEVTFYAMMLSASTKLSDNQVVFHASHNNLAGAGAAISVASIGAGKAAMRKQKGLDGATLNIQPAILLVSPDKETEALQYLAPITANDSVKVNPHVGTLEPVVAAELSGNAWYLFASPDEAAVYQWGLLDGYTAPRIRFDEPFGTQGMAMTVEHDFGVGAIDYLGGYKNPGA